MLPTYITGEQKKRYFETNTSYCPFCESSNFEVEEPKIESSDEITRTFLCLNCEKKWKDIYVLAQVEVV